MDLEDSAEAVGVEESLEEVCRGVVLLGGVCRGAVLLGEAGVDHLVVQDGDLLVRQDLLLFAWRKRLPVRPSPRG